VKQYLTAAAWETASGIWFTVPHHTPDRKIAEDTFQKIVEDIEKWNLFTDTKPPEKGL
jgi:hypothetical protein